MTLKGFLKKNCYIFNIVSSFTPSLSKWTLSWQLGEEAAAELQWLLGLLGRSALLIVQ